MWIQSENKDLINLDALSRIYISTNDDKRKYGILGEMRDNEKNSCVLEEHSTKENCEKAFDFFRDQLELEDVLMPDRRIDEDC